MMLRGNSWALGLGSVLIGWAFSLSAVADGLNPSAPNVLNAAKSAGNFYFVEGQWGQNDSTKGRWYGSMQIQNLTNPSVSHLTSHVHVVDADGNGQDMTFKLQLVHSEVARGFFDVKREGEDEVIGSGYCAYSAARQEVCHYAVHGQDHSVVEETFIFSPTGSSYEVFGSRTSKDADGKMLKTIWAAAGRQR